MRPGATAANRRPRNGAEHISPLHNHDRFLFSVRSKTNTVPKTPILIGCDPAIDDSVAILFALATPSQEVAACIDGSIIHTERLRCAVETKGELTLGQTVVDRREKFAWTHLPLIQAAADMDARRFLDLLVTTICREDGFRKEKA